MNNKLNRTGQMLVSFLKAVIFYTAIPIPKNWQLIPNSSDNENSQSLLLTYSHSLPQSLATNFQETKLSFGRVARWSPAIGLLLGGLLGLMDEALNLLSWPLLTRSAAVVACWVALTGGLHLDGAIDTADGLAVSDPQRRLAVMQDSTVGAFGVVAAALLLLLKTAALSDLSTCRWLTLMAAAGWGRWGQVGAIAFYPYLKKTGKGAFHKQDFRFPLDLGWGIPFLVVLSGIWALCHPSLWYLSLAIFLMGAAISLLVGFWFYRRLGGQTGDTYGAVVEWTEALILCCLSGWLN